MLKKIPDQVLATVGNTGVFGSKKWCEIPFLVQGKLPTDELFDILLRTLPCLTLRKTLLAFDNVNKDDPLTEPIRLDLIARLEVLRRKLSRWYLRHHEEAFKGYGYYPTHETASTSRRFRDPHTATSIALYAVANIFFLHLSSVAYATPVNLMCKHHGAAILAAVEFHRESGVQSGGSFVMIYPMKVVVLLTPCEMQRREALELLEKWGPERGLQNKCTFSKSLPMGKMLADSRHN